MSNTISIREFARLESVSDTLVHRALKAGRLARAADGGIDRALVGSAWRTRREGANTRPNTAANHALQSEFAVCTAPTRNTLSIREFARRERVSDTLVHRALKDGRLARAADGGIDPALVGSAWRANRGGPDSANTDANTSNTANAGANTANGANTDSHAAAELQGGATKGLPYGEALRLKENWLALLRRLEYEHKSGTLVELPVAQRVVFELCREQRDAWLAWPMRVAPFIAVEFGIVDHERLAAALTEHVYRQLAELGEPDARFEAAQA